MGDEKNAAGIRIQAFRQPLYHLDVQVVGWLV